MSDNKENYAIVLLKTITDTLAKNENHIFTNLSDDDLKIIKHLYDLEKVTGNRGYGYEFIGYSISKKAKLFQC
jgi:hypothetical protein